jgi:hypothetical protein
MEIRRVGSQPSGKGPAEYFTGMVLMDPLFGPSDSARWNGVSVTFATQRSILPTATKARSAVRRGLRLPSRRLCSARLRDGADVVGQPAFLRPTIIRAGSWPR